MTDSLLTPSIISELTALYTSSTRHYHTLTHITSLLSLLSAHRPLFTDPLAVEAAIWFHDAIYDSRAKPPLNELQSAVLAVSLLRASVERERLLRIKVMIEATASHEVPTTKELGVRPGEKGDGFLKDAAMFLDMDLAILGAEEGVYAEYERGVRDEYAWIGEEEWKVGRGRVLSGFLERERIYYSEVFKGLFEERARRNLRGSLGRLERG